MAREEHDPPPWMAVLRNDRILKRKLWIRNAMSLIMLKPAFNSTQSDAAI